ncbi:MAG: hypothetical protein LBD84_02230 [Campylobacteraceae bacterium]|nr:hypothetical protein [Campylobacteraceae bacterium]
MKNTAELENQYDVDEMDFYSKNTFLNFPKLEKIIASYKSTFDVQQYILGSVKKEYKIIDRGVGEAPFGCLKYAIHAVKVYCITDKMDK